jgi:hypothetical protein
MGSILQRGQRDVWALSGGALIDSLKTLGRSVRDLQLPADEATHEDLGDGVAATAIFPDTHLIPGFWKIDGYSRVSEMLRTSQGQEGKNYFEFPYDWRRDNRVAARRLKRTAAQWLSAWRARSGNSQAKLVIVAHSMGGLVARYFLEVLQGWRDTRMVITFGTPYLGSLNALNFLANGYKKFIGPLNLMDISKLVRSFTSVYQLLPIYPCLDAGDGRLQRLGVADVPNMDLARTKAALEFHREIGAAVTANQSERAYIERRYALHCITGTFQPTLQVARIAGAGLELSDQYPGLSSVQGDGTVPDVSTRPIESEELTRQHRQIFVSETHGSLQNSPAMLDHIRGILRGDVASGAQFRAGILNIGIVLKVDDVYSAGESVRIKVACKGATADLKVSVMEVRGKRDVAKRTLSRVSDLFRSHEFGRLPEGLYRVRVTSERLGSISDVFLVSG